MTSPLDIAYRDIDLEPGARRHLERLTVSWNLLADLCFSDLLLYVPADSLGFAEPGRSTTRFVVMGQVRPTTNPTLFDIDLVGQVVSSKEVELVLESLRTGAISIGEQRTDAGDGHVRLECIPVRYSGQVVGIMCRQWAPSITRRRGSLERVYLDLFERLSAMVTDGIFPFPDDDLPVESAPRVGDGVIVVDDRGRISYASPNAVSALHRIGIMSAMSGATLPALGLDTSVVQDAFATRLPVVEEIERRSDTTLLIRCIPLVAVGELTGGAVLLRDVTDVRRRDRLLLTKDATIREVHHRVKNNLQTISSLLRLQARRLDTEAGRSALAEAERRIRAIAVVHEILSRESGDQVPFDEIVHALVRMAQETSDAPNAVAVRVDGHLGDLPADMATPLSVVLAELLQNAVEHAFGPPGSSGAAASEPDSRIDLVFAHDTDALNVTVQDNGKGLPEGFDIELTRSLGLSIVRDLVRTQLYGKITMTSAGGTLVRLRLPIAGSPDGVG
ncbi:MAG: sensor histidine kinase [Acidimicrobiales bacterium]